MTEPKVSFIIPYYNAGDTIQETIDSIFAQSYSNFDVWIVNDGSTDEQSIRKLKEFEQTKEIQVLDLTKGGPGKARNTAAFLSKAEFFVFLDADDLIEIHTLSFLLDEIKETDDVVYGNCQYFGSKTGMKIQHQSSLKDIFIGNPIALCALYRANSFRKVGFDPYLDNLGLEDWEMFIHMFSLGMNVRYINTPSLFKIRVSDHSRTFRVANKNIEKVLAYISQKHHDKLYQNYLELYRDLKYEKTSLEHQIGTLVLRPYRLIKKLFKR